MSERFFILDGPGFLFRAYHALPFLSTSRGVPSHAVFGMSTMLWKLLREDTPDYFAVAWDPPGPTFREEKFAAYKETRAPTPDDLRSQISYVKTLFEALHLPVLEVPGFEADDVLGTVVERTRDLPIELVLVTSDKDMLQLVSPRVRVFSTTGRGGDRVVFDEAAVKAKWGVEPAQIPDILALMGDSIDNIPGVPGVGEKTAAKLIGQFGGVERLYENLSLVPGKLRETLAANRKQALLSRELATVSTRVPIAVDLETFRRREPDWDKLRALWTELEFHTLLRQVPAAPPRWRRPGGTRSPSPTRRRSREYLGRVPAGDPLAIESVGEGGPPDPTITALGLYHPAAGAARVAVASPADEPGRALVAALGGRTLIGHDAKALAEWWLARGGALPPGEDTAVAAYLLNPARTNYKLEEVCAELLGEGPGIAPPGTRGKWIWDLWAMAPRALAEVGLASLYEDIERPLIGVLAEMERHGIRIDQVRLGEFSRELEVHLERTTREIFGLAGEEFNIGSPKQLAYILFEKLKLPPVRQHQDGLLHRRRRARAAGAGPRAARAHHRAPHAGQAQVDLRRRAAPAGESHHRAPAHLVQPARGRDGTLELFSGYAPRHTLFVLGDRSKRTFRERIGFLSERKKADLAATIARQSNKSVGELLTLHDPGEILQARRPLLAAYRGPDGRVPQAFHVFLHKFVAGGDTCTLPRAEQIVEALTSSGAEVPAFLDEAVSGQYFEVRVRKIVHEPKVPMYDIAVDGEEYIADGIVVHNSSAPNLQNIPVRTELGRRIRAAFVPDPGWRFVAADYSQIELRILAHVSGEESLIEAFRRGEDIHARTASEVFGVALDAVTPEQRDIAKTTNFAVIYGVTAFGLSRGLDMSTKQAQEFLDRFFARHPKVKAYLGRTVAEGRERGFVATLLGRRRYLPELRSGNPNLRGFGERMATNAPIQGTAADLVKIAMVRMARELRAHGLESRMLLQVHDELLFETPAAEVGRLQALATEVMESALALDVPLKVDVKVGDDWAAV